MKHPKILTSIIKKINNLGENQGLRIQNFLPDLLHAFINLIDSPIFILIKQVDQEIIKKQLDCYWSDDSVIFLSSYEKFLSPDGFNSKNKESYNRSSDLLSSGYGSIKTIISSKDGSLMPIINSNTGLCLDLNKNLDYDMCLSFLKKDEYESVDIVRSHGQFALRGGIIDVFPFISEFPYRINFIDGDVEIHKFNVNSQITLNRVSNFLINPKSNKGLLSVHETLPDDFLRFEYRNNILSIGMDSNVETIKIQIMQKQGYMLKGSKINNKYNIIFYPYLTSVGIHDQNDLFLPEWFNKKDSSDINIINKSTHVKHLNISIGDYLVHRDHGVGICIGLSKQNKNDQELLILKYADGGIISVDIDKLSMVSFYASSETEGITLDNLSKQGAWLRKLSSAKKRAELAVEQLLNLYVKRKEIKRSPYLPSLEFENSFLNSFPYKDTLDQASAWKDISLDLELKYPMDRLLCGDVGFGKTELAIRAAFRVVLGNKRVIVLAPTTILANQLYSAFSSRLEPFAINVDIVSRFKNKKNITILKNKILSTENNVLIGTHAVLNDPVFIKNIGLLIIDEEHRFGVKQKEKIKNQYNNIDMLSMSATPIPRSINLALSNIFSISMLQTPPLMRRSIFTQVSYYDDNLICSSINFELNRGGQVYFIHNDINSIKLIVDRLQSSINGNIDYIHGQESSNVIEKKMLAFVDGKINVLVCTSIIESGIDVPSANCIIINNSHLFGLSQLYQMRGRVGRGSIQAYAYLLIPKGVSLSEKAFKRIKTIEENITLGSGYNIALSDMEIRGSGSLFGYVQSGGGGPIGYEMYSQLVQNAINHNLINNNIDNNYGIEKINIRFFLNRFIPNTYISSEEIRLSIYRSIASNLNKKELNSFIFNLENRFGPIPDPLSNLINESKLKPNLLKAGILSVLRKGCGLVVKFKSISEEGVDLAFLNYIEMFWSKLNIKYHVIPVQDATFSFCIHLKDNKDSFSNFSTFIDKFTLYSNFK